MRALLDSARALLDQGQDSAALVEIDKALAHDPTHKVAATLARTVRKDPMALLGRASFAYRVEPGDTMATIAQRFLGDRDQFWSLARYNAIRVPRLLHVGQILRVPGKARPAGAVVVAAAAAAPPVTGAMVVLSEAEAEVEAQRVDRERKDAVERATGLARAAMSRGDRCAALQAWEQVLRFEPYHREALQQRDRALAMASAKGRGGSGGC